MKMRGFILSATLLIAVSAVASAGTVGTFSIVSPDRPRTWLVGGNERLDQRLRWSDRKNKLFLDVSYSLFFYTDGLHPTQYQTYTVSFPEVHLSSVNRTLFVDDGHGHQTIVGYLKYGLFGQQVDLCPNVTLSANREDGFLNAKLIVAGQGGDS
jgi:hypothetical protein